jgi:hypothetical protein
MGWACGAYGSLREGDRLGDPVEEGRIILSWIFRKWQGVVRTEKSNSFSYFIGSLFLALSPFSPFPFLSSALPVPFTFLFGLLPSAPCLSSPFSVSSPFYIIFLLPIPKRII